MTIDVDINRNRNIQCTTMQHTNRRLGSDSQQKNGGSRVIIKHRLHNYTIDTGEIAPAKKDTIKFAHNFEWLSACISYIKRVNLNIKDVKFLTLNRTTRSSDPKSPISLLRSEPSLAGLAADYYK